MKFSASSLATTSLLLGQASASAVRLETRSSLNSHVANVHVAYDAPVEGPVDFTYGPCDAETSRDAHHVVARSSPSSESGETQQHDRLVWVLPRDAESGGCLSAWGQDPDAGASSSSSKLLGRSKPQKFHDELHLSKRSTISKRGKRNVSSSGRSSNSNGSIEMTRENGFELWGPWFDGVEFLKGSKDGGGSTHVDAAKAKKKEVAVVGAGMSGIMTYLVLTQAGLTNVSILEGSHRPGGRIRTEHLSTGPGVRSYQEMGPMRIPVTASIGGRTYNISDQQIVLQVADEINRINREAGRVGGDGGKEDLEVAFIPFLQRSNNSFVYYGGVKMADGLPPTQADVARNASLGAPAAELPASAAALKAKVDEALPGQEFLAQIAEDYYQAHAEFFTNRGPAGLPGDHWSEFAFLVDYLNGSLADANLLTAGVDTESYLTRMYHTMLYSNEDLVTIDGGMERLPAAFRPLIDADTTYDAKVDRISFDAGAGRLTVGWRRNYTEPLETRDYDYAVMSAPFSVVQRMRLPEISPVLRNAITTMNFNTACKVALEYRTRFWEHLDRPIHGSCDTATDIPGLGSVCYPSYGINSTQGPASVLASYEVNRPLGVNWDAVPEDQHVRYVVDAMAELHGDVALEQWTGKYARKCWTQDEFAAGAGWAEPNVGNHELYIPEYFKTHSNIIFVGEHTAYTHAWISSALESGVRGAVQLLLELGLVDEAKEAVEKWMARFISVVSIDLSQPILDNANIEITVRCNLA